MSLVSPALEVDSLLLSHQGSPRKTLVKVNRFHVYEVFALIQYTSTISVSLRKKKFLDILREILKVVYLGVKELWN